MTTRIPRLWISPSVFKYSTCEEIFSDIQPLRSVPVVQRKVAFAKALNACSTHVLPANAEEATNIAYRKQELLLDMLVILLSDDNQSLAEELYTDLLRALIRNIFREIIPPLRKPVNDDDDTQTNSSWAQTRILYDIFLRLLQVLPPTHQTASALSEYFFIQYLFDLFSIEDARERDYLKTATHRLYSRFISSRSHIRRTILHMSYEITLLNSEREGISEILEVVSSFINGFSVPLKNEHIVFAQEALLPLHRCKKLSLFHQTLSYCMTQLLEKDQSLLPPMIVALMNYWPESNTAKEVLFLNELEEFFEFCSAEQFAQLLPIILIPVSRCINSHSFQVSERTNIFMNNACVWKLILQFRDQTFPILLEKLIIAGKHWNSTDIDPMFFDHISKIIEMKIKSSCKGYWSPLIREPIFDDRIDANKADNNLMQSLTLCDLDIIGRLQEKKIS